jgi:hypothetical protein
LSYRERERERRKVYTPRRINVGVLMLSICLMGEEWYILSICGKLTTNVGRVVSPVSTKHLVMDSMMWYRSGRGDRGRGRERGR